MAPCYLENMFIPIISFSLLAPQPPKDPFIYPHQPKLTFPTADANARGTPPALLIHIQALSQPLRRSQLKYTG